MQINTKDIYEQMKQLEGGIDIQDIPEIKRLIEKFEDAISCIIYQPEKLNPTLAYNLQLIISRLIDVLKDKNNNLRKSQIASIISIIDFLISGQTRGLIKLPTGAGKTRLFTEIVTSLNLPTVILVPKINLKGQTSEYFEGENVFNIGENGTVLQDVTKTLQTIRKHNITNPIIIITYQSFVRLKEDKKLFQDFSEMIKVVIRDEAHRSLGDKTQEAMDDMHSYGEIDTEMLQEQDKDLLETDVLLSNEKLELLFTATPNLLDKSVRDTYEEIFGLRIQDLVEEGVLHMPKFVQVSEAFIDIGNQSIGERILNQFATKFMNEKKEFTYIEIVNKYLELKQENHGYLPAVGFCRNIEHAEFLKNYLEERGLRAIRVTSSNGKYDAGVSEDEAKRMLEANEIDVVLTVTKVSEGWDVPTLRCALNFAPILSEAKYIQGAGRVLRTFDYEKDQETNETNGTLPKNYAYVIEPKFWNISSAGGGFGEGEGSEGGDDGEEKLPKKTTKISGITHFIDSGEFDVQYLKDLYGDLDEYGNVISQEEVLEFFKSKTFEEWMNLAVGSIGYITFKGKTIRNLAKISEWDNPNKVNIYSQSGFQEFIAWVFGREPEILTKERVLEFFKSKTFKEWMKLTKENIRKIKFRGKKIMTLTKISEWDNPNNMNIYSESWFEEFIAWVFGLELEILTKEQVLEFFKSETFEEWMNLAVGGIGGITFEGEKIKSLAKISGWDNPDKVNIYSQLGFQEFIAWVFGREPEILTKERVLEFFKSKTFEEWMKLTKEDIRKIEFKGKKIHKLTILSGWGNPNKVRLPSASGFQEFLAWVFDGEGELLTKEQVLEFFKSKTFEEWMRLDKIGIEKIGFRGKKIMSLAMISGWDNPNKVLESSVSGFQEFIAWVFEGELIKEQVLEFFKTKTFEEWMRSNEKDIRWGIRFKGRTVRELAKISGWDNSNNIDIYSQLGFQEFIAWVFGRELEILTKEQALEFFKTKTFEEWMNLTAIDIRKMEFKGRPITSLIPLFGWRNDDIHTPIGFQKFIAWVFGKKLR